MRPRHLLLALALLPAAAPAAPPPSTPPGLQESIRFTQVPERLELPALDLEKLRAEDEKDRAAGKPPRYAVPVQTAPVTPPADGVWETLDDGTRVWRYRVEAEGATSVQPAFTQFHLPEGATLYVYGNEGKRVRGPYTREHNARHGELWIPIIEGEYATIELALAPGVKREAVDLEMTRVLHGYEPFWKTEVGTKETNSCNVDVECPVADGWEDPIASVAALGFGEQGRFCSGQMVNDTAFSGRPLFLTANHCQIRESNAASVTVYWNFENSFCREVGSSPEPFMERGNGRIDDAQSGARFLARYASSDFTLLELSRMPDPEWDVYWTGWDRRDRTFGVGVGIHHPAGEEKRISFENDTLDVIGGNEPLDVLGGDRLYQVLTGLNREDARPRSHFMVNDWDLGVTEQGSSGSGLWNAQKRLVGQLHGGASHTCGNNDFDWYGRLSMSWEGGDTVDSSLEPWLDPLGSGAEVQDGRDGDCNAPSVSIPEFGGSVVAGAPVTLSAEGGGPAVRFLWDVDGDGIADAEGRQIQARFTEAGQREIQLIASNPGQACGTTLKRGVTVRAPDLQVASVSQPFEIQGDGDGVMEPGERWGLRVALKNEGGARADNPRAVFTTANGEAGTLGPDGFGYTAAGSQSSATCPYQFENIGGTNAVNFQASGSFNANDDGGSDGIAMNNFQFYGESVNAMVMSSNGYLAPSVARDGGDFSNDCPLPARVDGDPSGFPVNGHARLAAYHDDLVTHAAFQQRFADCPRPGDAPGGNGACQIFQWNNVDVLDPATYQSPGGPQPFDIGRFRFQVILYEGTNQIVYQYGPTAPTSSSTPTVGIQDNRAQQGLTWGCDGFNGVQAPVRPSPNSAVCFFHPKAQPPGFDPDAVNLLTPALAYENIPPGGTKLSALEFEIDEDTECGAQFAISLHGVVFDGGFSPGPGAFFTDRVGGANARCDANAQASGTKADIDFLPGMYFNPARDGHGVDIHTGGGDAFLVWFTYGPDRQPVWYLAQGAYENNQIVADLLRFTDGNVGGPETVGQVIVTFVGETRAMFNWTLDGESGGESFQYLKAGGDAPPVQPTGHWFPPSQAGWGMTFNDQGDTEFAVVYFYDEQGQPVWTLGVKNAPANQTINLDQFKGVCPGCDWAAPSAQAAGSLERTFSDAETGSVKTNITLVPPLDGRWNRGEVPINILSDPIE